MSRLMHELVEQSARFLGEMAVQLEREERSPAEVAQLLRAQELRLAAAAATYAHAPQYELVRVSRELIEGLIEQGESAPVVVAGITRHADGSCDLWFRQTALEAELETARAQAHEWEERYHELLASSSGVTPQ